MKSASNKTASKNLSYAQTLTNWLESSPDSAEHLGRLEALASGSRDKTVEGMFEHLLEALMSRMPDGLEPAEMFGFLERQFQESHSERDNVGPGDD